MKFVDENGMFEWLPGDPHEAVPRVLGRVWSKDIVDGEVVNFLVDGPPDVTLVVTQPLEGGE